jgi:hypothetical protein
LNIENNIIYITIDVDWVCDPIFASTIELIEKHQIPVTIFVTHETPLLDRLKDNKQIELGIHPNFNNLLDGSSKTTSKKIISDIMKIVPEATAVRSHALTSGSVLSAQFYEAGLRRESNIYCHISQNIPPPVYDPSGMLRIFHFWEDDCHCIWMDKRMETDWNPLRFLTADGIKIFDFHPIHLFLNTESFNRYELSRPYHRNFEQLKEHINTRGEGALLFFEDLINQAKQRGFHFGKINEISL